MFRTHLIKLSPIPKAFTEKEIMVDSIESLLLVYKYECSSIIVSICHFDEVPNEVNILVKFTAIYCSLGGVNDGGENV